MLCITVPFQSVPFKLSIRPAIFWNSYFSEQLLFRTAIFHNSYYRSSYQRCSIKKAVLQNFAIFTGKNLCWSLFLIKLQAFSATTLLKTRLQLKCFPANITKFLRTSILKNICERLLLCLTDFSEQLVFREAIFQYSLSNIFISNFYFTFVSINTFISLNNFITYRDSHAKYSKYTNIHYDKENNSRNFLILLMYVFSYTVPLWIKVSMKNPP